MKKAFSVIFLTLLTASFFGVIAPAKADGVCICSDGTATGTTCTTDGSCANDAICSGKTPEKCGAAPTGTSTGNGTPSTSTTALTNPIGTKICAATESGQQCIQHVLGSVIKTAMGIVGSIALLMAVWGGFLWLTSMGNESRVETGKKTLIWSILGLVLIFGAYALTNYIFSAIANAPTK
jgi:type IV secretory pathway VirB2 component (pilin)